MLAVLRPVLQRSSSHPILIQPTLQQSHEETTTTIASAPSSPKSSSTAAFKLIVPNPSYKPSQHRSWQQQAQAPLDDDTKQQPAPSSSAPSSSSSSSSSKSSIECSICFTTMKTPFYTCNECGTNAAICRSCIEQYIESKLKDAFAHVPLLLCPLPNCKRRLLHSEYRAVMSPQTYQRYNQLAERSLSIRCGSCHCTKSLLPAKTPRDGDEAARWLTEAAVIMEQKQAMVVLERVKGYDSNDTTMQSVIDVFLRGVSERRFKSESVLRIKRLEAEEKELQKALNTWKQTDRDYCDGKKRLRELAKLKTSVEAESHGLQTTQQSIRRRLALARSRLKAFLTEKERREAAKAKAKEAAAAKEATEGKVKDEVKVQEKSVPPPAPSLSSRRLRRRRGTSGSQPPQQQQQPQQPVQSQQSKLETEVATIRAELAPVKAKLDDIADCVRKIADEQRSLETLQTALRQAKVTELGIQRVSTELRTAKQQAPNFKRLVYDTFIHMATWFVNDPQLQASLVLRFTAKPPYHLIWTACCHTPHCFRCKVNSHHSQCTVLSSIGELRSCPSCGCLLAKGDGCSSVMCGCGHTFDWTSARRVNIPPPPPPPAPPATTTTTTTTTTPAQRRRRIRRPGSAATPASAVAVRRLPSSTPRRRRPVSAAAPAPAPVPAPEPGTPQQQQQQQQPVQQRRRPASAASSARTHVYRRRRRVPVQRPPFGSATPRILGF